MMRVLILSNSPQTQSRIARLVASSQEYSDPYLVESMPDFWDVFHEVLPQIVFFEMDGLDYFALSIIRDLKAIYSNIQFVAISAAGKDQLKAHYLDGDMDYVLNEADEMERIPFILHSLVESYNRKVSVLN